MSGINKPPRVEPPEITTYEAAMALSTDEALSRQKMLEGPEKNQQMYAALKKGCLEGTGDSFDPTSPNVSAKVRNRFYLNLLNGRYSSAAARFIESQCPREYNSAQVIDAITFTRVPSEAKGLGRWFKPEGSSKTEKKELDINRRAQVLLYALCTDSNKPLDKLSKSFDAYSAKGPAKKSISDSLITEAHLRYIYKRYRSPSMFMQSIDDLILALSQQNDLNKVKEYADAKHLLARILYRDGYSYFLKYMHLRSNADSLKKAEAFKNMRYDAKAHNGIPVDNFASVPPKPEPDANDPGPGLQDREAEIAKIIAEKSGGDYLQANRTFEAILDAYAKELIRKAGNNETLIAQVEDKVDAAREGFKRRNSHLFGPVEGEYIPDEGD